MSLRLDGLELPHSWEGTNLVVPHDRRAEVGELLDEVDALLSEPVGSLAEEEEPELADRRPLIAGWRRRLAGGVVDAFTSASWGGAIWWLADPGRRPSVGTSMVATMSFGVYVVAATALWGRTAGKFVVGTQVVVEATRERPGWTRAALRWIVPASAGVIGLLPTVGSVLYLAGIIVVYVGVAIDPRSRGLHDRAAGTIVVRVGSE